MYYLGTPAQFLYGLKDTACKENGALVVVAVVIAVGIACHETVVEIVVVVNEVYLHAGCLQRCHLDDQRVVSVVNDEVHARQTDNFVQLVTSFIYVAPFGCEDSDLLAKVLCCLWQVEAYACHRRFGDKWSDFLSYE